MNRRSINRAKAVLHNVGSAVHLLEQKQDAKNALKAHLERIHQRPTKSGVQKLHSLIDDAMEKERYAARNKLYESRQLQNLKNNLDIETKKNQMLMQEVEKLNKKIQEFQHIKDFHDKRKQVLENQIKQDVPRKRNDEVEQKIEALEEKYQEFKKSGKYSDSELRIIREKIKKIKENL